ncbi:calcium-binding protein [Sphingopyxis sp. XHP0097]|uniref:Calcium-binding protein n=1 Tax=Sphingopyxis jiangsuensis TaxID=2871171 RepID=A0ABS7MCM8_9SPHN|nr:MULTISPECIES: calcium-binding protein [Sphingopyxis]MBL0767552.1 calcium-binding protein [Sphingopyxis lutea]MBY4636780.1 calcium-binding protein [Sphingopyxis jiangsuensis]
MLKQLLFVGAAAVSFPALAQEQPVPEPTDPPTQTDPITDPMTEPVPQSAPVATPAPQPSTPPNEGTAATPAQIAQIVDQEFPTYDSDANGELSETEFAAWMKKLRVATEPGVDPESEAVKSWIGQAFAAADADKSTGVNKTELTGFLARGA